MYCCIRNNFIGSKIIKPKCWIHFLDLEIDYRIIYSIPFEMWSRIFQYKFLNNCLVNDYWLTKWGIEQNDKCNFCSLQTETQMHMFWECEKVHDFLNQIKEWMIRRNVNLVINSQIVFLGSKYITELKYLIILLGSSLFIVSV
jgi:hypothetical protein